MVCAARCDIGGMHVSVALDIDGDCKIPSVSTPFWAPSNTCLHVGTHQWIQEGRSGRSSIEVNIEIR